MNRILVIEDDKSITRLLKVALETNNYEVLTASTGIEGISKYLSDQPNLILLDMGLPDIDGSEVLSQIRDISKIPIIIVSARGKEDEKVSALDSGANDYVTKPFNINELLARVRAQLRASVRVDTANIFEVKDLKVDFDKRLVIRKDVEIHLTKIEFNILKLLIENRGKVLTHRFIQKNIWGYESEDDFQTLRVFMGQLRRKIEDNSNDPQFIFTEIGVGYRFIDG